MEHTIIVRMQAPWGAIIIRTAADAAREASLRAAAEERTQSMARGSVTVEADDGRPSETHRDADTDAYTADAADTEAWIRSDARQNDGDTPAPI